MLKDIDVKLEIDFFKKREELKELADKVVFTGMIDEYFDFKYGHLEYRSLEFENELLDIENYQGNAVVNYTDRETPYTRILEHKHFEFGKQEKTVITREYPSEWEFGDDPYYPVNDDKNNELFEKYKDLANEEEDVIFGGRLADYHYYDMHHVIFHALKVSSYELN
jgi:UDP-galactopyranose mutase